jgi:hypothetical protein
MLRKISAALIILGWISLSGFDLIEDLDEVPCEAAISSSSPGDGLTPKRGGWPLANNSVESAARAERADAVITTLTPAIFRSDSVIDFRKHSQLHKLHRVFLI